MGTPHVLQNIGIPKLDPNNTIHERLAELSEEAHKPSKNDEQQTIQNIEEEMDNLPAQLSGLSESELKEIKTCVADLR